MPQDTLEGIDTIISDTKQCRSELIREACLLYIEERKRVSMRERMKAGYQEMAELNRLLAEEIASDFGISSFEDAPLWRKV